MKNWFMAARPKTLTASFIPVIVGTALAGIQLSFVQWSLAISSFLFAVCIQVGSNLINDALDFKKGVDTEDRIGPVRVSQRGLISASQVLACGIAFLFLGSLLGFPLIMRGGGVIAFLLVVAVFLAYLYTGGPFPLSYKGLGEVFVFLFYGLVGTGGAYYIQTLAVSSAAIVAGVQIGCLATLIIAVNNLRDYESDKAANKKTPAVRYGIIFGKWIITVCALIPFLLNFYWFRVHCYGAALMPWLVIPLALQIVQKIWQNQPSEIYNRIFAHSALLHLLFGLLLSGGLLL